MKLLLVLALTGLVHGAMVPREPAAARIEVPAQFSYMKPETETARREFNAKTVNRWNLQAYSNVTEVFQKNIRGQFTAKDLKGGPRSPREDGLKDLAAAETGASSLAKRQTYGNWVPVGFDACDWDWWLKWYKPSCYQTDSKDFATGHVIKTVVSNNQTLGDDGYMWWVNDTDKTFNKWYDTSRCLIADGWTTQCQNKIWKIETQTWETYNNSVHANYGWTTGNSSYNGHTVRTIWDCLLNRTAVEYGTYVTATGAKPVQYYHGSMKYYRWMDDNRFAWFAACPAVWGQYKRKLGGSQPNPIWDFETYEKRHKQSDMTPYPTNLISNYNSRTSYTGMYSPSDDIWIDGQRCAYMAVTRPGLRHWTARMLDVPPQTWPKIQDEPEFPAQYNTWRLWSQQKGESMWRWYFW